MAFSDWQRVPELLPDSVIQLASADPILGAYHGQSRLHIWRIPAFQSPLDEYLKDRGK